MEQMVIGIAVATPLVTAGIVFGVLRASLNGTRLDVTEIKGDVKKLLSADATCRQAHRDHERRLEKLEA